MDGPYPHYPLYCSQSEPCLSIGTVGQEKRWDFLSILSSVLQPSKVTRNHFELKIITYADDRYQVKGKIMNKNSHW